MLLIPLTLLFGRLASVLAVPGSTKLERVVTSRCNLWGHLNKVEDIPCTKIWKEFNSVLMSNATRSTCPMNPDLFDPMVDNIFQYVPMIKNPVLWSKTGTLVPGLCLASEICNSIETTLAGYMFDQLNWCDLTLTGGIRYETSCGCSGQANLVYSFWKSASRAYSNRISGNVGIFLNGSLPSPFDRHRTMGTSELPNIRYPRVTKVIVYLVHDLDDDSERQTCENESVNELRNEIISRGIDYECQEDPAFVVHYQCLRQPTHFRCGMTGSSNRLIYNVLLVSQTSLMLTFGRSILW